MTVGMAENATNAHACQIYSGGGWVDAEGGQIDLVDPTTEEILGRSLDASATSVRLAVGAARRAHDQGAWRGLDLASRTAVLARLMALVAEHGEWFAQAQTAQMGVPISIARALVAGAGRMFQAYVEGSNRIEFQYLHRDAVGQSLVSLEPVGVVAIVIPWNGPLSSVVSKAIPALLMGCTVVLKPAPETPWEAGRFAELATEAGLPDGVFNVVTGGATTGEALVSDPRVDKVSFTGSTAAGRRVGEICGRSFTRTSLELGGKSAAIVLADADIASTAGDLLNGNFFNTGQICVAVSRVLVPRAQQQEWVEALCTGGSTRIVGDPRQDTTQIGPLVSNRQRERVEQYIRAGRDAGARVVLGGGRPAGLDRGWFVEPTIFAGVTNDMVIAREEIFGPVMSVIAYDDEDDAVAIANRSDYDLHGAVFGADPAHALAVARQIHTGSVGINTANLTPGTPYGGRRLSGLGREHGRQGLESFLESCSYVIPAALAETFGVPTAR